MHQCPSLAHIVPVSYTHPDEYKRQDNAYVSGNIIQITPQIPGTVVGVLVDDTDRVEQGQPLVRLDPADTEVQLSACKTLCATSVPVSAQQS